VLDGAYTSPTLSAAQLRAMPYAVRTRQPRTSLPGAFGTRSAGGTWRRRAILRLRAGTPPQSTDREPDFPAHDFGLTTRSAHLLCFPASEGAFHLIARFHVVPGDSEGCSQSPASAEQHYESVSRRSARAILTEKWCGQLFACCSVRPSAFTLQICSRPKRSISDQLTPGFWRIGAAQRGCFVPPHCHSIS